MSMPAMNPIYEEDIESSMDFSFDEMTLRSRDDFGDMDPVEVEYDDPLVFGKDSALEWDSNGITDTFGVVRILLIISLVVTVIFMVLGIIAGLRLIPGFVVMIAGITGCVVIFSGPIAMMLMFPGAMDDLFGSMGNSIEGGSSEKMREDLGLHDPSDSFWGSNSEILRYDDSDYPGFDVYYEPDETWGPGFPWYLTVMMGLIMLGCGISCISISRKGDMRDEGYGAEYGESDFEYDDEDDDTIDVLERLRKKQQRRKAWEEHHKARVSPAAPSPIKCPSCGREQTRPDAEFCYKCGGPLKKEPKETRRVERPADAARKCNKCGILLIPPEAEFCQICGADQRIDAIGSEPSEPGPGREAAVQDVPGCTGCGESLVTPDAAFCQKCGAAQEGTVIITSGEDSGNPCIKCGTPVQPPLVFCDRCMAAMSDEKEPAAGPSSPGPSTTISEQPAGGYGLYSTASASTHISLEPQSYAPSFFQQAYVPSISPSTSQPSSRPFIQPSIPPSTPPSTQPITPGSTYPAPPSIPQPTSPNSTSPAYTPPVQTPPVEPQATTPGDLGIVTITCEGCGKAYRGQIVTVPSSVECPFCRRQKIIRNL